MTDLTGPHRDQEKIDEFVAWFDKNGGHIRPSVEIRPFTSGGYCARLRESSSVIDAGDRIIACPHDLTISFADLSSSSHSDLSFLAAPDKGDPSSAYEPVSALSFFLVEQYFLGKKSRWWPYIQLLPGPEDQNAFDTPFWYTESDLVWLQGTNLGKATERRREVWLKEYDLGMKIIAKHLPTKDISSWTWQHFLWASSIITSRAFPSLAVRNDPRVSRVLVPGLDLLNHSPLARVAWEWGDRTCAIVTDAELVPGREIFNNYGQKGNEELLMGYGFCIENNAADTFNVGFSEAMLHKINVARERDHTVESLDTTIRSSEPGVDFAALDHSLVMEQHWIRLRRSVQETDHNGEHVPSFDVDISLGFLHNFSIALENNRERGASDKSYRWPEITPRHIKSLSRNQYHVLNAFVMLLDRSEADIRQHDKDLPSSPQNKRQRDAKNYRDNQLELLGTAITSLKSLLRDTEKDMIHSTRPKFSILRMKDILTTGPRQLVKDLRSAMHIAFGTRDAKKIRQRGGDECAYTLYLNALHQFAKHATQADEDALDPRLLTWLRYMQGHYASDMSSNGQSSDDMEIVTSYQPVLDAMRAKSADTLFAEIDDPTAELNSLLWCLKVVREEGVRRVSCMDERADDDQEEDEDELVLFLEQSS